MFLAMDRLGDDLQNLVDDMVHDAALSALTRAIEIDLEEMIDRRDSPKPLQPVDHLLW